MDQELLKVLCQCFADIEKNIENETGIASLIAAYCSDVLEDVYAHMMTEETAAQRLADMRASGWDEEALDAFFADLPELLRPRMG